MTTAVTGPATMELVDEVMALYDELAMVTTVFREALQDGPPDEAAQSQFWTARKDLVARLQPLLALEGQWPSPADEPQQVEHRQALARQVQKMERVATLDAQVRSGLAFWQAQLDAKIKSLAHGKKGLAGYRVGLKGSPRFCRLTA